MKKIKITAEMAQQETAGKMRGCPFCGALPVAEPWHGGGPHKIMISCISDFCVVQPSVTGETPAEALKNWNTRVIQSPNKRVVKDDRTIEARDWMG